MAVTSASLLQSLSSASYPSLLKPKYFAAASIHGRLPSTNLRHGIRAIPRHPPCRHAVEGRRKRGGARAAYVTAPAADPEPIAKGESAVEDISPASPAAVSWGVIWSLLSRDKLRMVVSLSSLIGCTVCTLSMPIYSGICDLLAVMMKQNHGLDVNPLADFVICCGQSEAFAATILATIDQGDEVLIFDPAYETYESCILLAGGVPVYVPLDMPYWTLNVDKFLRSFTRRTKAVILNSPHNPTGKVFCKEELETIAAACCKMDCLAITDEVYEYITFGTHKHVSLASLPGMQERTIITSSLSKTFSVTGWRIGWACAPTTIASAIRNIHVKITDSAPAPFQEAALIALRSPPEYFDSLKAEYEARREFIIQMLSDIGFQIHVQPQGSVFVFAELPKNWQLSDIDFAKALIKKAGVAAVPGCGFFHGDYNGKNNRYVRFAFCKSSETLHSAAKKMRDVLGYTGHLQL